jgi:hypothetical protein
MYDESKKAANAAAGRAASMRAGVTKLKDLKAMRLKNDTSIPFVTLGPNSSDFADANKASRQISDRSRTIARLESRSERSERSAKYRLAKAKADKKMSKPSKTGKMLDDMEMKQAPRRPFISKASKKGNK